MLKKKGLFKAAGRMMLAAVLSGCVFSCASLYASANGYFGKKLIADMTNLKVEYSAEYATTYGEITMRGATEWNSNRHTMLGFDMSWQRVLDGSEPTVSAYTRYAPFSSAIASTAAYADKGDIVAVDQSRTNWTFCTIYINTVYEPDVSTLTHEFGHILGLDESEDPYSIMCQLGDGRIATKPALVDIVALNQLYCLN